MRRFAAFLAVAATALASTPAGALAVDSGVHIDPGSPAGKQYAVPLTSARSDAAGTSAGSVAGSQAPPPFGVGVHPSTSSSAGPTAPPASTDAPVRTARPAVRHSAHRAHVHSLRRRATPAPTPTGGAAEDLSRAGVRTSDAGTGWAALAGGGALVLLLGGLGGLALRRRGE